MTNEKNIIEQNSKKRITRWSTDNKRVYNESDSESLLSLHHQFANGDSVTDCHASYQPDGR